jgi:hypothetical protein
MVYLCVTKAKKMTQEIKIGDRVQNTITKKIETVKKIKYGYINEYRADLWTLKQSQPSQPVVNIFKDINKALSGRMSEQEQENFEGKLFGTYK